MLLSTIGVLAAAGCISPGGPPSGTPPASGTGNLVVTVKDSNGAPLAGAKVVSSSQPEGQVVLNGITVQPGGTVRFENIRPGEYRIAVSRFDYAPQETAAGVTAGQTTAVTVKMVRAPPSTTPSPVTYSQYELEYRLIDRFGDVFFCDPDYYPISREGQEQQNALDQFNSIRSNTAEFSAILGRLGLADKPDYTSDEKLAVYREHKKLKYAVQMTASDKGYEFVLRVGEGQGSRDRKSVV